MNIELKEKKKRKISVTHNKPKIGFLGVGWIGRNRMEAIAKSELAEIVGIADPSRELVIKAKELAPKSKGFGNMKEMLGLELDGIIIATPSAMHAEQAMIALENKIAVFCQKPLGRDSKETLQVIEAAKSADRLLGVDLSYRYLRGMQIIKNILGQGEIGKVYAVNLVFHNAYGPDKAWFYDPLLAGGGCLIDLGIHLVDLVLWVFNYPEVSNISSRLFHSGSPLSSRYEAVEDYATARFDLENGAAVNLTCSWKVSAGCDAVIDISFFGTEGGLSVKNINGTFYDFKAERYRWTAREVLSEEPGDWGPQAALRWIEQLAINNRYDNEIEHIADVADILDRIYSSDDKLKNKL